MKFGARIFKTGLAILITLTICHAFNMPSAIIAVVASVVAIQPSLKRSSEYMWQQIQASSVGTVAAIIFLKFFGSGPVIAAFVVMITISLNIKFKMEKSIPLAVITVLAIMEITTQDIYLYSLQRFGLIMLGITVSLIVNHIFATRDYDKKLQKEFVDLERIADTLFKTMNHEQRNITFIKQQIKDMGNTLESATQILKFYKDDYYWILYKKKKDKKGVLMLQRIFDYYVSLHELFNFLNQPYNQKIILHSNHGHILENLLSQLNKEQQNFALMFNKALSIDKENNATVDHATLHEFTQNISREDLPELSIIVRVYDQIKHIHRLRDLYVRINYKRETREI